MHGRERWHCMHARTGTQARTCASVVVHRASVCGCVGMRACTHGLVQRHVRVHACMRVRGEEGGRTGMAWGREEFAWLVGP